MRGEKNIYCGISLSNYFLRLPLVGISGDLLLNSKNLYRKLQFCSCFFLEEKVFQQHIVITHMIIRWFYLTSRMKLIIQAVKVCQLVNK